MASEPSDRLPHPSNLQQASSIHHSPFASCPAALSPGAAWEHCPTGIGIDSELRGHWLHAESQQHHGGCSSSPTPSPSSVSTSTSTSTSSFFFGERCGDRGGGGGCGVAECSSSTCSLSEAGSMTVREERNAAQTAPVVRKPVGSVAYGVHEEPRYRPAMANRVGTAKASDKVLRSTETRPPRCHLKEYNTAHYPVQIRLPDGEERHLPHYQNFRLHTEDERMDNVICAPPNVTVDASVCENMSWNGAHRCQGSPPGAGVGCPPPYGSLAMGDINLKPDTAPAGAASSPSKSGKIKEVLSSFGRAIWPGSGRASCRKSSNGSGGGGCGGGTAPTETRGSGPVASGPRWSMRRASPPHGGSTGSPSGGFDPPPSYERVVKEKKEMEDAAKKNTPPK